MANEFNSGDGIEISPGPRGFSIIGFEVSPDGTTAYPLTDKPGKLNGIPLPRGPRGYVGDYGDPGEGRIRVDETVGYRVFVWDVRTPGEHMVYGDTGLWTLPNGSLVRRTDNMVETNAADPSTLPEGFRPAIPGRTGTYLTVDAWPSTVTGTVTAAPVEHMGLEGYEAAVSQGYPGSAEEWMNMVYRVVLPAGGTNGQVLTRTAVGSTWKNLPQIGPGSWVNVTMTNRWKLSRKAAMLSVRNNNGTIEFIGDVTYTGPSTRVGVWGPEFIHIGNIPPGFAPEAGVDITIRLFKGDPGLGTANYPVPARVNIDTAGRVSLGAYHINGDRWTPVEPGETQVSLTGISYALRNSPTATI